MSDIAFLILCVIGGILGFISGYLIRKGEEK